MDARGVGPGSGPAASESLSHTEEIPASLPTVQDALLAARRALAAARPCAGLAFVRRGEIFGRAILAQLDRRLEALEPWRGISTAEWFAELPVLEARVTLLLALLELARLQRILLGQKEEFGAVLLKRLA